MKPVSQSELLDTIMTALGEPMLQTSALITRHSLRETRRKLNLLLAEDNAVNQTLAIRLLEKMGHTVTLANNGLEALQHWQNHPFDAILMDVDMPEMNGYEATQRIRELEKTNGKHIPIVAMTAHAMQGAREECLRHGMDGYLTKPINTEALWRELDNLAQSLTGKTPAEVKRRAQMSVADFAKVREMMDDSRELYNEISNLFLTDTPVYLQHIREGILTSNADEVRQNAHTIKGMVGIFAAERALQASIDVEQYAEQPALLTEAMAELEAALAELIAAIHAYQW